MSADRSRPTRTRMVREVAAREIRSRGRTRSFRLITAFMVLAAIVGPILLAVWPSGGDDLRKVDIGVAADLDTAIEPLLVTISADQLELTFVPLTGLTDTTTDEALASGELDVVIEADDVTAWNERPDEEIELFVEAALQQVAALQRGASVGLSEDETIDLFQPLVVTKRFVDAPDTSDDDIRRVIALIGLLVAFMLPQVFGQLTLLGVVEEKATRVVEVLLSHIKPRTLLLGKVLGLSALALVQLTVVIAGLVAALLATNRIDIPSSVWRFVPMLAISVIGGLLLYNTVFALLGSLISRQEDASQVVLPVLLPLMAGFFVGQFSALGDPDTLIAKIFTYIPFTSPMLLPVRIARDAIAPWEVALALGILALSIWLLLRMAGRVYQFTLLHSGSAVSWKQAWLFARGSDLSVTPAALPENGSG
jgi:ABC-2 type transport system permease protein